MAGVFVVAVWWVPGGLNHQKPAPPTTASVVKPTSMLRRGKSSAGGHGGGCATPFFIAGTAGDAWKEEGAARTGGILAAVPVTGASSGFWLCLFSSRGNHEDSIAEGGACIETGVIMLACEKGCVGVCSGSGR